MQRQLATLAAGRHALTRPNLQPCSFGGRSPERTAADALRSLFTFAAAKIVLAQLEGSGRGGLRAYDGEAYAALSSALEAWSSPAPAPPGPGLTRADAWLAALARVHLPAALRVMVGERRRGGWGGRARDRAHAAADAAITTTTSLGRARRVRGVRFRVGLLEEAGRGRHRRRQHLPDAGPGRGRHGGGGRDAAARGGRPGVKQGGEGRRERVSSERTCSVATPPSPPPCRRPAFTRALDRMAADPLPALLAAAAAHPPSPSNPWSLADDARLWRRVAAAASAGKRHGAPALHAAAAGLAGRAAGAPAEAAGAAAACVSGLAASRVAPPAATGVRVRLALALDAGAARGALAPAAAARALACLAVLGWRPGASATDALAAAALGGEGAPAPAVAARVVLSCAELGARPPRAVAAAACRALVGAGARPTPAAAAAALRAAALLEAPPPPRALAALARAAAAREPGGAPAAARTIARAASALARLSPVGGRPPAAAVAALAGALAARLAPSRGGAGDPPRRPPAARHVASALHGLGSLRAPPDAALAASAARALRATRARQRDAAVALQGLALLNAPPPSEDADWLAARAAGVGGGAAPRAGDAARVLWAAATLRASLPPATAAALAAAVDDARRQGRLTLADEGYVAEAAAAESER